MALVQATILIVDDDVELLNTLADFLDIESFKAVTASSGEEGLKKLADTKPDLIILDISMPGMGGVAFLKRLSAVDGCENIPVCVFTARANMEEFFTDVSVAGFLAKPCDPDELIRKIRTILAAQAAKPASPGASPAPEKRGAAKVLIAEDDTGHREAIVAALIAGGYDVSAVSGGDKVLEAAIIEKPHVILMKLVMQNMNGDATAGMLHGMSATREIPIILYDDTGSAPRQKAFSENGPRTWQFIRSSEPDDLVSGVKSMLVG